MEIRSLHCLSVDLIKFIVHHQSTQLKIISGDVEPSYGKIFKSPANLRLSFLRQEFLDHIDPSRSLLDEILSVFSEELSILQGIELLEAKIRSCVDNSVLERLLNEFHDLNNNAKALRTDHVRPKAVKAALLLGFNEDDLGRKMSHFSGGWKMRAGLAKILCQDP